MYNEPRIKNPWIRLPFIYVAFVVLMIFVFFYAVFWSLIAAIKTFYEDFMCYIYYNNDLMKLVDDGSFTDTKNYNKSDSPNGKA